MSKRKVRKRRHRLDFIKLPSFGLRVKLGKLKKEIKQ